MSARSFVFVVMAYGAVGLTVACRPAGMPTSGGLVVTGIEYSRDHWNERIRQGVPTDALIDVVPWLDETGVSSLPGGTDGDVYTDSTPYRLTIRFAGQPARTFDVNDCYEPSVCAFLEKLEDAQLIRRFDKGGCDGSRRAEWGAPRSLPAALAESSNAEPVGSKSSGTVEAPPSGGICEIDPSACPKQSDIKALAELNVLRTRGPDGRCRLQRDGWPVGLLAPRGPRGG